MSKAAGVEKPAPELEGEEPEAHPCDPRGVQAEELLHKALVAGATLRDTHAILSDGYRESAIDAHVR